MDPSSARHHRILIWRSEVASASLLDDAASDPSAPSLTTTTTLSSLDDSLDASSSISSLFPRRALLARTRRLLFRLSAALPGAKHRAAPCSPSSDSDSSPNHNHNHNHNHLPDLDGPPCRTAMYHMLRPAADADADALPDLRDDHLLAAMVTLHAASHAARHTSASPVPSPAPPPDAPRKRRFRFSRARRLLSRS